MTAFPLVSCLSRIGWAGMATFLLRTRARANCRAKKESRTPFESCRDSAGSRKPACLVTTSRTFLRTIRVMCKLQNYILMRPERHMRSRSSCITKLRDLPDSDTIRLMSTPRCSLPDIVGSEDMLRRRRRRKRYALSGLKWHKTDLTWRCFPVTLWLYAFFLWVSDMFLNIIFNHVLLREVYESHKSNHSFLEYSASSKDQKNLFYLLLASQKKLLYSKPLTVV